MRKAIYQAMLAIPFKVVGFSIGLAGFFGSVWPDRVKQVIGGSEITIQNGGIWLLVFSVGYFALLWLLKPGAADDNGSGGTTITTRGRNSPGFGQVGGNVTINHHHGVQDATQWPKSPYGSGLRRVEGTKGRVLAQMLEDDDLSQGLGRPRLADVIVQRMREEKKRCPKMPIYIAIRQIAARIGDKDGKSGFPKARQQFRQAALEDRIDVWGQAQIPPTSLDDNRHKGVWSPVDASHWADHGLHPRCVERDKQEWPHTEEEELGQIRDCYWNLKVRSEQIERNWPKPARTTNVAGA